VEKWGGRRASKRRQRAHLKTNQLQETIDLLPLIYDKLIVGDPAFLGDKKIIDLAGTDILVIAQPLEVADYELPYKKWLQKLSTGDGRDREEVSTAEQELARLNLVRLNIDEEAGLIAWGYNVLLSKTTR
jgi:hypothetical protein